MKLSFVVATPDVKGTDATAYIGPIEPFLVKLHAWGYDGVELMVREPAEVDTASLKRLLRDNDLEVSLVNTGRVYLDDGLSLMLPPGEECEAARERICALIDFAAEVTGASHPLGPQINAGLLRGQIHPGQDAATARAWVVENLHFVAQYAYTRGVNIALEPINRYQSNFVNKAEQALMLAREVGLRNLRLQMDVFHMNVEERSLCGSLVRYQEAISHIHICDTNREAPGTGHFDFVEIVDVLDAISYKGFLSAELAAINQERAAELTAARLKPLLTKSLP